MQVGIPNKRGFSGNAPAGRAFGSEPAAAPAPSIPMYVAGLIVTYAGLHAANLSLGDPSFAALILGLTLIGFAASYITRRQNIAPRNVELPALVVCVCVVLMAVITDPADSFLAPVSVAEDRSKALALLLTWLTVFRSFTLTSDAALLFCCVPTIALIGLVGTSTADPALPMVFVVFVAASVFMMVHENVRQTAAALRERRMKASGRTAAAWSGQLQATAVCTVLAIILANVLTPGFQAVGAFVRVNSGLTTIRNLADRATATRTSTEQNTTLTVATGPVSLSDDIVFTVQSKEAANWRGQTFDRYDGRGWENLTSGSATQLIEGPDTATDPPRPDYRTYVHEVEASQRASHFHELKQHFRFVQGSTQTVYGAAEIHKLAISQRTVFSDTGGSVRLKDAYTNAEYDVFSEVGDMTPEAQRAIPGNYPRGMSKYTTTPGMVPDILEKIRRQALDATQGQRSQYAKVNALMVWLGHQCKYNTNTAGYPSNRDVVDYFLFDVKQGYCDIFATSLAVLCRSINIPARVASGYLSGDLDSAGDSYVVKDKHKHLWTEVYFNGVGWVSFDSTALAEDISPTKAAQQAKSAGFWAGLFKYGWWPPALLGVVLLLLLYVLKVEVIDRYFRPRREGNPLGLPETNAAIVHTYDELCRTLARKGARRLPAETATEFLARAGNALTVFPGAQVALDDLTSLVVRFRYSANVASTDDVDRSQQAAVKLLQALRGARRGLLLAPSESA